MFNNLGISSSVGAIGNVNGLVSHAAGAPAAREPALLASNTQLPGGPDNDSLLGTGADEVLDGAGGDDTLNGNGGFDTLYGGDGNDRFVLADWSSSTTIDGGSGIDTLDYSRLEVAGGLTVNLAIATVTKGSYGALTGTDTIANIEGVIGTRLDDALLGNDAANQLDGGDGSDTLSGGVGNDLLRGGAGHDHISQDSANADDNDSIDGGDGDDRLSYMGAGFSVNVDLSAGSISKFRDNASAGTDTVSHIEQVIGSRFNDTMNGSALADMLGGYEGDDRMRGNAGNDTLRGYDGDDALVGDAGNDVLDGGDGADSLIGGAGNNSVSGGDGDDLLAQDNYRSIDTLDGGDGIDTVDYSAAQVSGNQFGLIVDLGAGTTRTNMGLFSTLKDRLSNLENVIGTTGKDQLFGDAHANSLRGDAGNDVLDGGDGNDSLDGGVGNDAIRGGKDDDVITQTDFKGSDTIDGGDGIDIADYSNAGEDAARIVLDLQAGTVAKFLNDVKVGSDTIHNIERVIGAAQDDRIAGSSLAETLAGGAGDDTLSGAGGQDLLDGGTGNDRFIGAWNGDATIAGGSDVDTLDYSALKGTVATSHVEIDLRAGTVRKIYNGALTGIDHLSNIAQVIGSAYADTLDGDAGANTLDGAGGNDTLNGHGGNSSIAGGAGDDLIMQDAMADYSTVDGGEGVDTLTYAGVSGSIHLMFGTVSKYQGANLVGIDIVRKVEQVIGSAHADTLDGGSSAETLSGEAGDDSIAGGDGRDMLFGGAGNDTLHGESDYDYLDGGDGNDDLAGGEGNDMLYGQNGNDTLNGGNGTDNLRGGAGNDLLVQDILNDSNNFDGGDGRDTLDYSDATAPDGAIAVNVAKHTVSKYINKTLIGTDTFANIERIVASRYADTLLGSAATDRLDGGAGDDTVDGGGGYDHLYGGAGNDRFVVTIRADDASIDGGSGFDTLDYSGNTGAGSGIIANLHERMVVKLKNGEAYGYDTVSNIEAVIGTRYNDTLIGGDSDDVLNSGAGNDSVWGGGQADCITQDVFNGNDTIDGDAGFDTLDYSAATAAGARVTVDLKARSVTKYLGATVVGTDRISNIEAIIGSVNNDSMVGGEHGDSMDGAAGNDSLDGGSDGNDTLNGGAGNDTLTGGLAGDSLAGGEGNDRLVQTTLSGSDTLDGGMGIDILDYGQLPEDGIFRAVYVELDKGTVAKIGPEAAGSIDLVSNIEVVIGTSQRDYLGGGNNADDLRGGGGDDFLRGQSGNDTLSGGSGADTFLQDDLHGSDAIDGGDGADTLTYRLFAGDKLHIAANLAAGMVTHYQNDLAVGIDKFSNIECVIGTDFNDTLLGSVNADTLNGAGGNDSIAAGAGNDTIRQVAMNDDDTLDGGAGSDEVNYSGAEITGTAVFVNLAEGRITKYLQELIVGHDTVRNIEKVTGTTSADTMAGGASAEILNGDRGNDALSGGAGNDTLNGDFAEQNDFLMVDDLNDTLSGGSGNDSLFGGQGVDILNGDDGNDALAGGFDADVLNGGAGNDTANGDAGDDRFVQADQAGSDSLNGGDGVDTLDYSQLPASVTWTSINLDGGYALKYAWFTDTGIDTLASIERVIGSSASDHMTAAATGSQLEGRGGDDQLRGRAGNDVLNGGSGSDAVSGAGGDDRIVQDSVNGDDSLDGGDGIDTVDYCGITESNTAISLGPDLVVTKAMLRAPPFGRDTLTNVEHIIGTRNNDLMIGSVGIVSLNGDDGNDTLSGSEGNDQLLGGAGNDLIIQKEWSGYDTLDGGDWTDMLNYSTVDLGNASIKLNMTTGTVEKYVSDQVIGVDRIVRIEQVMGTAQGDEMSAGRTDVQFSGRGGADTLYGGDGDDVLIGGDGNDILGGGTGDDRLNGGADDDYINGGTGNDTITQSHLQGNDTLDGGSGDDIADYSAMTAAGVSIAVDFTAGTVIKSQAGVVVGTDRLFNIDHVIGNGITYDLHPQNATPPDGAGDDRIARLPADLAHEPVTLTGIPRPSMVDAFAAA